MNTNLGKSITWLIALVSLAAWMAGGRCFGEPPDTGLFAGTIDDHAFRILESDLVGKDLGLTDYQANGIRALNDELGQAFSSALRSRFQNGRTKAARMPNYGAPVRKKLAALLRPEQLERFTEIVNQDEGPEFFNTSPDCGEPSLVKEFGLSAEQQRKINVILDRYVARWYGPIDPGGSTIESRYIWEQSIGQSALDEIINALTPVQRRHYSRCVGRPIDLVKLAEQSAPPYGGFQFPECKFKP